MAVSEPDANHTTLTIRILGRDYSVACPDHERDSLLKSAEHLSGRMQAIQRRGKTLGIERIAVMAALNIAHDLINLQAADNGSQRRNDSSASAESAPVSGYDNRLSQIQQRIDTALDDSS